MKKFLALLICFTMLFSCVSIGCATTYSDAIYTSLDAYYLEHYLPQEGKAEDAEAIMLDLDYDDRMELLYSKSVRAEGFTVCQQQDGQVVELPHKIQFKPDADECEMNILMDEDGYAYFYMTYYYPFHSEGIDYEEQIIYTWSKDGLVPVQYLGICKKQTASQVICEYTTDTRGIFHADSFKVPVTQEEVSAMSWAFLQKVQPYIVWSSFPHLRDELASSFISYDVYSDLYRIGMEQKMRLERSLSEIGVYMILQIGSPDMNIGGFQKSIDGENGTVPVIVNGRTLIPVRAVLEELGGVVGWDDVTRTVTLSTGKTTIELTIDSTTAYRNGEAYTLDVAPVIINGRTMLPVRFIAESVGFKVDWKEQTQQVWIRIPSVKDAEWLPDHKG